MTNHTQKPLRTTIPSQGSESAALLADYAAMPQAPNTPESNAALLEDRLHVGAEEAQEPRLLPREIGGRDGLEPTRYGDWEKSGRCIDF